MRDFMICKALQTVNLIMNNKTITLIEGEEIEVTMEEYVKAPSGYLEPTEAGAKPPEENKKRKR